MIGSVRKAYRILQNIYRMDELLQPIDTDRQKLMLGKLLAQAVNVKGPVASLREVEFQVFSQWGDDGIIQWLVGNLEFPSNSFIEFGVENYAESNTRFLLMNNNWSGLVMDGSESHVAAIRKADYFWRHSLLAKAAFIDVGNINGLLSDAGCHREPGILHIDIDGNDYWIWKAINVISPIVVIVEYNSIFGLERAITIPYDGAFVRSKAHYSNLYWGASLRALQELASDKGYSFVGCNSAGNNAYFVRRDRLNRAVHEASLEEGYVLSAFRESRDQNGQLTFLSGVDRLAAICGMPIHNLRSGKIESI